MISARYLSPHVPVAHMFPDAHSYQYCFSDSVWSLVGNGGHPRFPAVR